MIDLPATVFLVGAGPGDPGLITVRGLELLRSADVVLYDRLVDPRLVDEAPAEAERIFVGKKPGGPSMPQAQIDGFIVDRARGGRRVVRLKGGDPFVFGRGADEAQALAAAGVAFEIVPGVTSAIAVPAYAGIPVTHSGASSSFAVITAHESSSRPGSAQRWSELARGAGTLILVMGVGSLDDTARRLIEAGRDESEPSAVIERGTTSEQRTVVATLGTIADAARSADIGSPAITIVGQVVRLRDALSWYESRPLFGRRVVLTRSRTDNAEWARELEGLGAEVISMPLIAIEHTRSSTELLAGLDLDDFRWFVFSSRNAVDAVAGELRRGGPRKHGIAAVGPSTAARLKELNVAADAVSPDATGSGLAEALGPGPGRVLVPTSEGRESRVADELERRGWDVVRIPAYRAVPVAPGGWQATVIEEGGYDAIVFASGSAVESFVASFGGAEMAERGDDPRRRVVAIGPSTAAGLERNHMPVDSVAQDPSTAGLTKAVLNLFRD